MKMSLFTFLYSFSFLFVFFNFFFQSFLDLQYSFLDVSPEEDKCKDDSQKGTPKKKIKTSEEEKSVKRADKNSSATRAEPNVMETDERTGSKPMDFSSNEQLVISDILTTFPETPPSSELDNHERILKQEEK